MKKGIEIVDVLKPLCLKIVLVLGLLMEALKVFLKMQAPLVVENSTRLL